MPQAIRKIIEMLQNTTGVRYNITQAKTVLQKGGEFEAFVNDLRKGKKMKISTVSNLQVEDLERIPKRWINDELISYFLSFKNNEFAARHVYTITSLEFCSLLALLCPNKNLPDDVEERINNPDVVRRMQKQNLPWSNLNSMKRLLVPIHIDKNWITSVADFERAIISIYDSYDPPLGTDNKFFQIFKIWIAAGIKFQLEKNAVISSSFVTNMDEWTLESNPSHGFQDNTNDCGVFAIGHMLLLSYPQTVDLQSIGTYLAPSVVPILRAELFALIRDNAVESRLERKGMEAPWRCMR
ncbi:hypothetical protein D9758_014635 [Tetrapyrgos nigripes]|uniref:Ubiquitin-like protease family profile domain-containing protein n=1 Tax=Tetrapyrgos nigripes TaxID=182062 RepID=A0A8H5CUE7_9AGAR|nr:hypothetical protein D9758_014635 [Tetrapyrgos nigripes]